MHNMVKELQLLIPFKKSTDIGDIILIAAKSPQILQYAVVTNITRDQTRRDEWWHIDFTFLSIPLQQATWTLRTEQMTGQEVFTMGGEERFVAAVDIETESQFDVEELEKDLASQTFAAPKPATKPAAPKNVGGLRRVK